MTFTKPLWILLLLVHISACSSYQGMFYAEHTHVGAQIKISPQTDNKPLDVNIGYDRGLLAVVPRTEYEGDAVSVISKTDLEIVFTTNSVIKNVFATGRAANNITRKGERVAALFGQCFEESPDFTKRKKNALAKLQTIQDSKDKVEGLYKNVFTAKTVTLLTTKDEMYKSLANRITIICDPKQDDDIMKLYENL